MFLLKTQRNEQEKLLLNLQRFHFQLNSYNVTVNWPKLPTVYIYTIYVFVTQ